MYYTISVSTVFPLIIAPQRLLNFETEVRR